MAIRSTQVLVSVLKRAHILRTTQVLVSVLRRQGEPAPVVPGPGNTIVITEPPDYVDGGLPASGIDNLTGRVQRLVQDATEVCFGSALVRRTVLAEIERLARKQLFGDIVWAQGERYKSTYRFDQHGIYVTSAEARGTQAYPASLTTATDLSADFVAAGVQVGDWVRNLHKGTIAVVSAVATNDLTCSEGFRLGSLDRTMVANEDGDAYVVERGLPPKSVIAVRSVSYGGKELHYVDMQQFERLRTGRNHKPGRPRYWTTDTTELPTFIRVFPAPAVTGSSTLVVPVAPWAMPWEDNLIAAIYLNPHPSDEPQTSSPDSWLLKPVGAAEPNFPVQIPLPFYHPVVLRAAASLLFDEGPCQNLPVAHACVALAKTYLNLLGVDDE